MMSRQPPLGATDRVSGPKPRIRLNQRTSHTKSRNGCYTCKHRRVKCDEKRPICGACSIRGDHCIFPNPASARSQPRRHPVPNSEGPSPDEYRQVTQEDMHGIPIRPLEFNVAHIERTSRSCLNMHDLYLLQHYILHTSKRMTLHHGKSLVWERVIPEIAATNKFLMHLLLALAGLDILKKESSPGFADNTSHFMGSSRSDESSQMVQNPPLLQIIIRHHQQGLKGLQEELGASSDSNAEDLLTGSMLIVGFAFASLGVKDLDPSIQTLRGAPAMDTTPQSFSHDLGRPQTQWLSLVRGVSSVAQQSWTVLKRSRLRPLLVFNNANEDWKIFQSDQSYSTGPPWGIRSKRLSLFASGASQAISHLRAFSNTLKTAIRPTINNSDPESVESPRSDHGAKSPTDYLLQAQDQAITVVEQMYMRILHVLWLRRIGVHSSADFEAQAEIEDTAIASWPNLITQSFIASLDLDEILGTAHVQSFAILAHLYLPLALLDNIWYFGETFDVEINKINALVIQLGDDQLVELMKWPMEVIKQ